MPYIHVDVDLDEFDTDELITELIGRIKENSVRKGLPPEKLKTIMEAVLMDFADILELTGLEYSVFPVKTLDDKMKVEHLSTVFEKYTLSHIQSVLP